MLSLPVGRGILNVQQLVLNYSQQFAGVDVLGEICFRSPHLSGGTLTTRHLRRSVFICRQRGRTLG